jgi:hypothetical protein
VKRKLSTDKTLTPPKILVGDAGEGSERQGEVNGHNNKSNINCKKRYLEILVQDAEATLDSINWKEPSVRVSFEGDYADACSKIEVGNVIEVTKFTVNDSPAGVFSGYEVMSSPVSTPVKVESGAGDHPDAANVIKSSIQVLPFTIVIRDPSSVNESTSSSTTTTSPSQRIASSQETEPMETSSSATPAISASSSHPITQHHHSLPFVSIKKSYCSLDNPLLLKVNLFGKKPENPSPGLRFTSKIVRREEIPGKCSSDGTPIKDESRRPASRMMTRRSCSSSSSTSPLSSPMTSRYPSASGGGKTRRSQAHV